MTPQATNNVHFLRQKPTADSTLVLMLERLLSEARSGEVVSLLYVTQHADATAEHGSAGGYVSHPAQAYYPLCAALADLSGDIREQSLPADRRRSI